MPLGSGTKLGPYEILSALGAGGMGEVRARDSKLGRDVDREARVTIDRMVSGAAGPTFVFVLNWFDELRRLTPSR